MGTSKSGCVSYRIWKRKGVSLLNQSIHSQFRFSFLLDSTFSLLYRDLKPENIGFDVRGDVKIFDFGLCKSLDRKKKAKGYGYNLTGRTGSTPYMAPEVCKGEPYDVEADVFSFAILLWELLSLQWAFNGYSIKEFYQRVALQNERLPVKSSWPVIVRTILVEAWVRSFISVNIDVPVLPIYIF